MSSDLKRNRSACPSGKCGSEKRAVALLLPEECLAGFGNNKIEQVGQVKTDFGLQLAYAVDFNAMYYSRKAWSSGKYVVTPASSRPALVNATVLCTSR